MPVDMAALAADLAAETAVTRARVFAGPAPAWPRSTHA